MLVLGIILIVVGLVVPKSVNSCLTIGIILLVIGAILWILGAVGRPVAGRRYWY